MNQQIDPLRKIITQTYRQMEEFRKIKNKSVKSLNKSENKIVYKPKKEQKRKASPAWHCNSCRNHFENRYIPWWWRNASVSYCSFCYDRLEKKYVEKNNINETDKK